MTSKSKNSSNVIDLNRSLKDKEVEIELLQETFTAIGSELDLNKIFQIVSERARDLISADTVLIPLLDENCESYTYRGGSGKNAEEIVGETLPLNYGVCGWVWKHKKPWWRGVLDELSDEERNRWEKEAGTMILVPLQGKRDFLGGIAGINEKGGSKFTRRDLNLLQLFASIVSVAIENAMIVTKMEKLNKLKDDYRMRLEILNKQLVESSKELEYLSLYDTVTLLPNRSLFRDRITQNIYQARKSRENIGLLLIDLDRFKDINDTLGHDKGDLVLKKIARRFHECVHANETLARLGGDEFVVILPSSDHEATIKRAQKLRAVLENTFSIDDTKIAVTASIGMAMYPDHGEDTGSLLSHVDSAMYMAKHNNLGICMYNPDQDHSSLVELALVADVRKAVDEKQYELYYQPKISLQDNKVTSVEALGRWASDSRGEVPPDIFIRVMEQTGLIDEYTYWAIATALKQAIAWNKAGHHIRIAVNVSPQTLMNPEFTDRLEQLIKDEATGQYIMFEITENLFLSEFDRLSSVLDIICRLGITLSIDDFGTGYSSLSRLKKMPVSELKIDQSFIKDMHVSQDDKIIVKSTIDLAHNLGLTVVAEGVETKESFDLLIKLGCDVAQGYFIEYPLPAEEFDEFIKNY